MKISIFFFGVSILLQAGFLDAFGQWVPMTPQYSPNVLSLALKGANVYAGMDNGVFASTDNGASWNASVLTGSTVRAIYVSDENIFAGTDSGVFVSTDNGSSWSRAGMVDTSIVAFCTMAGQLFAGTRGQGVFVTSDDGATWKLAGLAGDAVSALAVNGTKILASVSFMGAFVSLDSGRTWNASNNGLTTANVGPLLVGSTKTYLGADVGVFVSPDSGTNWTSLNSGWKYGQVTSIAQSGGNLVAGTATNGITYSTDNGLTWNASNLTSWTDPWYSMPVQIVCLAGSDSSVFAGTTSSGLEPTNSRWSGVFRSINHGLTWMPQGLSSSRIRTLISNGKYLFQGTDGGGVFTSKDDGVTWALANTGLTVPTVCSFAVKDSDIFASTLTDYGGIFRSTDNGGSWTLTTLKGRQIYSLAANDSFLLAGGPSGGTYTGGLFISTDNGASWTESIYSSGESGINSVAIGDTNFFATDLNNQGIFVSTDQGRSWMSQNGGSSIAVVGRNIFVGAFYNTVGFLSTDNGMTWSQTVTPGDIYRVVVSHDTMYAATDHGIFASADLGVNWGDVGAGLGHAWFWSLAVADGYLFAGSGTGQVWRRPLSQMNIVVLFPPALVSPKNDSSFFADSVRCVWNSVAGAAYYRLQVGYDSVFSNIFVYAPTIADTTFELKGLSKGTNYYWRVGAGDSATSSSWSRPWVFHVLRDTADHGMGWVQTSLSGSRVQALADRDSTLFVGTNSGGVLRSTDNGQTWSLVDSGLTCRNVSSLAVDGPYIYAGTYSDSGGVYHSANNGNSWSLTALNGRQIYTLTTDGTYLLAGGPAGANYTGGLFISTNSGASWTQSINRGSLGINSVAAGGNNFFATDLDDQGIFVSTDHGKSWTSQFGGSCIAIAGSDVFVGAFYRSGGYLSTDNGVTWSYVGANGPITATNALIATGTRILVAVPQAHVYMSADGGYIWTEVDKGLSEDITSFAVSDDYLFAGSSAGHVWKRLLSDIPTAVDRIPDAIPSRYSLRQNYPNPFNPTTVIEYQLPKAGEAMLKIYDVLGREVTTLVNGKQNAGYYSVTFNAGNLPSGVYFYRIEITSHDGEIFTADKKLLLLK